MCTTRLRCLASAALPQELAEKKTRIERDLEKLTRKAEIEGELREAIYSIEDDVEAVLWSMHEEKPLVLAWLLSLIFKRGSILSQGGRIVSMEQTRCAGWL